jgi:hypothetical protein
MALVLDGTNGISGNVMQSANTQATTSGTVIDFTSIPSTVKRITLALNGVSTSGTAFPILQLGSGTFTTSGYITRGMFAGQAAVGNITPPTNGFMLNTSSVGAGNHYGLVTLVTMGSNIWIAQTVTGYDLTGGSYGFIGGGSVTLSGILDRIRLTTSNNADTFDAGSANIIYE